MISFQLIEFLSWNPLVNKTNTLVMSPQKETISICWGVSSQKVLPHSSALISHASTSKPAYDFAGDDIDAYMIAMETTCNGTEGAEAPPSPTFPSRRTFSDTRDLESDPEGTVPGTPPQKRVRAEGSEHECVVESVRHCGPTDLLTTLQF